MKELRSLPKGTRAITDKVLSRGGLIKEGRKGKDGKYYECWWYPGALNYYKIQEVEGIPDWA